MPVSSRANPAWAKFGGFYNSHCPHKALLASHREHQYDLSSVLLSSPKLEVPSLLPFWCTWLVKGLKSYYRNMDTHSSQAGATDKTSAYNEPCWKVFPLALNLQHYSVMWRINIILKPCTYFLQDQGSRLICTAILLKFLKSLFNTWASKLVDFR